ncbi:M61 family metallopeptidase [Roseofilum sp. BLCC_M91]|uniref:M61 family metallopeptidase n=1 Tax=Roseofilum halophilum BLCC-M91 TaxID=3022259 RepID=A0ABT7BPD5_9CYAN|nr:M61 family metallopeptidase [Roseofilum halophilum]MDJ1180394.1 M61 family metallopeptidase [Roseofilum halophilum BLCC-M91]
MTQASIPQPTVSDTAQVAIAYQVAMPQPSNHLYEVTLRISDWQAGYLDLLFPVWSPGSYLVREYAKNLQEFKVNDSEGNPLLYHKKSKSHWHINTKNSSEILVFYRIYANELTVRTSHLDASHGYFNGTCLFFQVLGMEQNPIQVKIILPDPTWNISTALPKVPGKTTTFEANTFDHLVDSPFEIGTHDIYYFQTLNKSHELAVWGQGNLPAERAINDIEKIIQVESELFGGLPYDRYLFILHLARSRGGLEHKDSCSLIFDRFSFRDREKYASFMQLVAHEFFHLWNVKRLRPIGLETYDYTQENYTSSLWFCEGATSYYDMIIPLRAGIYNARHLLNELSKEITRYQNTPGRWIQPLHESSFDAWIKLYRSDANSRNNQISYYLKGELVSFLLDLMIRAHHQNRRSLDDVMLQMWEKFGKTETGYTPEQLQTTIETIAHIPLEDFFHTALDTTQDLEFNAYLKPFGLQLKSEIKSPDVPHLGITVKSEQGKNKVKYVESHSPAYKIGIDAGDELLALEGLRVSAEDLSDRLKDYDPGDSITLTLFHGDRLKTLTVTLAEPKPTSYYLSPLPNPSSLQLKNFEGWLGVSLTTVFSNGGKE